MNIVWAVRGPGISIRNFLGVEKKKFNSRAPTGHQKWPAAPVESSRFVALRSLGGFSGSVFDTCNRLHRMRGRFHRWIHISTGPQQCADNYHDPPKFSIKSSLENPKHCRMRCK